MVSAVLTTYKREPSMVLRALDSILLQTYQDLEVIVVDDSPCDYPQRTDVYSAVLRRQDEHRDIVIKYIAHEKNMGACVARNTGLEISRGEYIAYLDDDDEWLTDKIKKQIAVIEKSDAALVYCGSICKNDTTGRSVIKDKEYVRGKVFEKLLYYNFIESTSYPLIRKEYLVKVGGFDPLMQSAQDYDVWLRLAKQYIIDYVPEPLVIYHEHEGERITSNPDKKINGLERINEKYEQYLNADRELWWKRHIGIARYYALKGQFKASLIIWLKCVCKCPENLKDNFKYFFMIICAIKTHKKFG